MKLSPVPGKKIIKIFSIKGFQIVRQRSSHVQMKNDKGILITIPLHANKDVGIGIILKILRDTEITREEFLELESRV